jgi:predicted nucleic acid-binding protein
MIVVSDTSAVATLLQIGRTDLLRHLYQEVLIPETVRTELLVLHSSLPEFIRFSPVEDHNAMGRAVARREGINFVGLLGVLVQATFRGFIPSVYGVISEIEDGTTFPFSKEIKDVVLRTAGEL